jgi:hypothetical protein
MRALHELANTRQAGPGEAQERTLHGWIDIESAAQAHLLKAPDTASKAAP